MSVPHSSAVVGLQQTTWHAFSLDPNLLLMLDAQAHEFGVPSVISELHFVNITLCILHLQVIGILYYNIFFFHLHHDG